MSTLFSTPAERHIFLIGFFETACPWKARQPLPERYPFPLKAEYHYYLAGRASGFITLMLFCIGIAKLALEVLT